MTWRFISPSGQLLSVLLMPFLLSAQHTNEARQRRSLGFGLIDAWWFVGKTVFRSFEVWFVLDGPFSPPPEFYDFCGETVDILAEVRWKNRMKFDMTSRSKHVKV